jgi:biopolymer transport protein ExbD
MKKKKEKKRNADDLQLEMTPMIDVVFQLLIFFIVTLKQEDILSRLDVIRPAPDPTPPKEEKLHELLEITVYKEGYVVKGRAVNAKTLEGFLTTVASLNKNVSVIIRCTMDSPHYYLIRLLDICYKLGLTELSVFSM